MNFNLPFEGALVSELSTVDADVFSPLVRCPAEIEKSVGTGDSGKSI